MLLSIIVPCYNEKTTIKKIINKIIKLKIKKEVIVVDDGSIDGTTKILKNDLKNTVKKIIFHKKNKGKGAAIKSALKFIKGNIIIIQDADLEYDPSDYYSLIKPFSWKNVNVVYGSRVLGRKKKFTQHNFAKQFRIFANYTLTTISNFLNNQNLTDAHTCYKVFRKPVFLRLKIREKRFSFCPEVTTKLSRLNIKILEVPIRYQGRSYKDGKKIGLKDAFEAIFTILKYKLKKKF
mgnify:CR=1 FL=1|tara:strand:- start:345 stop:1049 length:705 start_codon:yes stop_codon:yes gene_type:complete